MCGISSAGLLTDFWLRGGQTLSLYASHTEQTFLVAGKEEEGQYMDAWPL